jgi:DNA-directed RNA polymerase III subunit RPC3
VIRAAAIPLCMRNHDDQSKHQGHAPIQSAGSLVTAALCYQSHIKHGSKTKADPVVTAADMTVFFTEDIVKYLPKPVLQLLEKKVGGMSVNLSKSWQELSERRNPEVVRRIGDNRYEIALSSLKSYLHDRIFYQIVHDRHGEVAARVLSIINSKGWLESETLAERAMVPAKDTREVLHHLYRSRYIDLFHLSTSRQYNPSKIM